MKRFLFQIKPKFLFNAIIFIIASTVNGINTAPKPRYDFSGNSSTNQNHITSDRPTTSSNSAIPANDIETPDAQPDESYDFSSSLIIKAINPGYTNADKLTNVGELIELQNLADTSISLAGFSIRYTNGSGKASILHTFAEGDLMTGEFLLMRYAKSPDADQSELTYSISLAMSAGPLELIYDGEVIDTVCWTGKDDCEKSFKTASPTTLARNPLSGNFEHLAAYEPHFDPSSPSFYSPDPEPDPEELSPAPQCRGLEFSEILTYYSDTAAEQFIEFYNSTSSNISLDGCKLEYKKKTYLLSGNIPAGSYLAYYPDSQFIFTKNPTTNNSILLIDTDGETVDELIYVHGQKKSTSFAKFYNSDGLAEWKLTYSPTPNSANNSQDFRTCPAGKVLNPVTGNCVNLATSTASECPAGKYRNPLTGRCKNIESTTSTLKECAEGYERNPATNRCRKITLPNNGADYALVPATSSSKTTFVALGVVILIVSLGVIYIALQFRHETTRAIRKIRQRVHNVLEDHLSRKIRRNRNKKS